jgi:hypothetical protein
MQLDTSKLWSIVTYAKIHSLSPTEFTQIHLDGWRKQRVQQEGITLTALDQAEKAFRRALRKGKLQRLFPKFNAAKRTQPAFSLFMEDMEHPLKADVRSIIEWAKAEAAKGSLRIGESILIQLEALCGYAVNILQIKDLDSVGPVLTEAFLTVYVDWLYEVRGRSRASIRPLISGLHTILLHHPRFAEQSITWWPNLLGHIDRDLAQRRGYPDGRSAKTDASRPDLDNSAIWRSTDGKPASGEQ